MDKALKLKVELIVLRLKEMINNVPESTMSDDGSQVTGHWSGTKDDMERSIGRKLDPIEVTILSLSRRYGPTPLLNNEESAELLSTIWPEGNNTGNWLGWSELLEVISEKFPLNNIRVTIEDVVTIMILKNIVTKTILRKEPCLAETLDALSSVMKRIPDLTICEELILHDDNEFYEPLQQMDFEEPTNVFKVNGLFLDSQMLSKYKEDGVWFGKGKGRLTFKEAGEWFL
jgi:hypothetical protein